MDSSKPHASRSRNMPEVWRVEAMKQEFPDNGITCVSLGSTPMRLACGIGGFPAVALLSRTPTTNRGDK